jgi:iron(II)-dependent oxidoreductase
MKATIIEQLGAARARTLALVDCLTDDEQRTPVSRLMSPFVWDLAHIGNYEELWLLREIDGRPAIDPTLDDLYNAFEHPRWERPSLPILGPAEARAYDARVREDVLDLLATLEIGERPDRPLLDHGFVHGMVIQHEHQHDETLLATHQLRGEQALSPPGTKPTPEVVTPINAREVRIDGGRVLIGTSDDPWAYDNERGAHWVKVDPFVLDTTLVTNRRYLEFMADGGYDEPHWWGEAGWAWRTENLATSPEFWRDEGGGDWTVLRFGQRLDVGGLLDEPVQHVCWHEADAFARWCGKRLPTEVEWETAATWDPLTGTKRRYPWGDDAPDETRANLGQRHAGPAPVGAYPAGASPHGVHGLIGDVWEWTSSTFRPYPGFVAFPYKEYSEVFWGDDYHVLRGGSWAADPVAVRGTFRNWDYPIRRQIFTGFRCARDVQDS